MASLDTLPADQRAVLQLVLQRGRSYDDIASMLSIDRAAVRQRALDGFDALGPSNSIPDLQRSLLTDYLLGQLPPRVAEQVRDRLAASPPERAWARVIASEVGSLSSSPLPEIPVGPARREETPAPSEEPATTGAVAGEPEAVVSAVPERRPRTAEPSRGAPGPARPSRPPRPPSSRRGGAVILGALAAAIVAIVIVLIATSGSSPKKTGQTASTPSTTQTGTTATTGTTGTSTTKARLVTQVNLVSPTGAKNSAGVAQVISEGTTLGVVIVAQGVPANTKSNAYAVWLYNSPGDSKLVGFVNQRVGSTGRLETEGPLPPNASHYKQMLVTVETQAKPKAPGTIVLEGSLKLS